MNYVYRLYIHLTPASERYSRASLSWVFNTYFIINFPYYGEPHKELESTLSEAEPVQFDTTSEPFSETMSQDGRNPAQLQGGNDSGPPAFQIIATLYSDYGLNKCS